MDKLSNNFSNNESTSKQNLSNGKPASSTVQEDFLAEPQTVYASQPSKSDIHMQSSGAMSISANNALQNNSSVNMRSEDDQSLVVSEDRKMASHRSVNVEEDILAHETLIQDEGPKAMD